MFWYQASVNYDGYMERCLKGILLDTRLRRKKLYDTASYMQSVLSGFVGSDYKINPRSSFRRIP